MRLDKTFRAETADLIRWKYRTLGAFVLSGAAALLVAFQTARSAEAPTHAARSDSDVQQEAARLIERTRGISMQWQPGGPSNGAVDPEELRKQEIVDKLRQLGKRGVPALARALSDPDVQMRLNAEIVLIDLAGAYFTSGKGKVDIREAIPALLKAAEDRDDSVRAGAAGSLAEIGPDAKEAVPVLIKLLQDHAEGPRNASCMALARIGPAAKDALPALNKALDDPSKDVRQFAFAAIVKIQGRGAGTGRISNGAKIVGYSGIICITGSLATNDDRDNVFVVPGYMLLMQGAVVKELKITADQKIKLHKIEAKYNAGGPPWFFGETITELPPDDAKLARERRGLGSFAEQRRDVEGVLTPQQTQTLKTLASREAAFGFLRDPGVLEGLGVTTEQEDALLLFHKEINDRRRKDSAEQTKREMAVLDPRQRKQLREEALGPAALEVHAVVIVDIDAETGRLSVPSPFPYPDFSQEQVQKELGLSPLQQKKARDLLGNSPSLTDKLVRELRDLSPEERKKKQAPAASTSGRYIGGNNAPSPEDLARQISADEERLKQARKARGAALEAAPIMQRSIQLRNKFEEMLTPAQLASYRDMAFQNIARFLLNDPIMLEKIGAIDQLAALRRISNECQESYQQYAREMGEKMLKVLAPRQQEMLQYRIERSEW